MSYNKNSVGANRLLQGFGQKRKKKHVKKAFDEGFLNRANEQGIPVAYAQNLLKEADGHNLFDLYPHDSESLYSLASKVPPSSHDDIDALKGIAKHILSSGIKPGLAGAAAGGAVGYAGSKLKDPKGKNHLRNSLIAAGVGGLAGGVSGAFHNAHELGENSKEYDKHYWENEYLKKTHEFDTDHHNDHSIGGDDDKFTQSSESIHKHIKDVDDIKWYDYFLHPYKASRKAGY